MLVLTLNCRSYSLKYQLYDWEGKKTLARGAVERISLGGCHIRHEVPGSDPFCLDWECADHREAIALVLRTLAPGVDDRSEISVVGHRVAHGGERFTRSVLIDEEVLEAVKEVEHLAPLHNPPNVAGIEAVNALLPGTPQVAIFDTAFHQTMPEHSYLYPLPLEWYEKHGVRRYGFHGALHLYATKRAAQLMGKKAEECNLITIHSGSGVSLCAVSNGVSVDTSMGLTPLEGAMMGSRCGDIDPGIPPFLMLEENLSPRDMETLLNQRSGLVGITGRFAERSQVLEHAAAGDQRCLLALEMEAYRLKKYIGAYIAVVGRPDALVFTAGEGGVEWPVREKALAGLEAMGIRLDSEKNRQADRGDCEYELHASDAPVRIFVIPADEEMVFVEDAVAILEGRHADYLHSVYGVAGASRVP